MLFNPLFLQVINNPETVNTVKPQKLNGSNYLFSDIIKVCVEKTEQDSPVNSSKSLTANSSLSFPGLLGNLSGSTANPTNGNTAESTLMQVLNNIIPQKINLTNAAGTDASAINKNGINTLLLSENEVKDLISKLINESFKGKIGVISQKTGNNAEGADIIKTIGDSGVSPSSLLELLKNGNTVALENSNVEKDQGLLISLVEIKGQNKSNGQTSAENKIKTIDELTSPDNMLADASALGVNVPVVVLSGLQNIIMGNSEQNITGAASPQDNAAPTYQMELSFISKYDMNNTDWDFPLAPGTIQPAVDQHEFLANILLSPDTVFGGGNELAADGPVQSGLSDLESLLNMKGIKLPSTTDTVPDESLKTLNQIDSKTQQGINTPGVPNTVTNANNTASVETGKILTQQVIAGNGKSNGNSEEIKNIINAAGVNDPVIVEAKTVKGVSSQKNTDQQTLANTVTAETVMPEQEIKPVESKEDKANRVLVNKPAENSKQQLTDIKPETNSADNETVLSSKKTSTVQAEPGEENKPLGSSDVSVVQNTTDKADAKANKTSKLLQDINLTMKPAKMQKGETTVNASKNSEPSAQLNSTIKTGQTADAFKVNTMTDEDVLKRASADQKIKASAVADDKTSAKPVVEAAITAEKNNVQSTDSKADVKVAAKQDTVTEKQNSPGENSTSSDKEQSHVAQDQSSTQDKSADFKAKLQDVHIVNNEIHKTADVNVKEKVFTEVPTPNNPVRTVKAAEIMKEISRFIQQNDNHSLTIKIDPESMGTVKIAVDMVNKMVHANIEVENEAARKLVENNINQLYSTLQQNGVQVSSMNISLASHDQKQGKAFAGKKKSLNQNEEGAFDEKTIEDGKKMGYNTYEYLI